MVIPYVAGMSEDIRRVCRKFNIRVVFKSGRTLCSMLTKVKDTLPPGKQSNVVYRIPCSCGQGGQELLVKEALHIQMTPVEMCFNQDGGLEVPGC